MGIEEATQKKSLLEEIREAEETGQCPRCHSQMVPSLNEALTALVEICTKRCGFIYSQSQYGKLELLTSLRKDMLKLDLDKFAGVPYLFGEILRILNKAEKEIEGRK